MSVSAPFRVILQMRIREGMAEEFEKTWVSVGDVVAGDPANLGQWLMRSTTGDGHYYIISDWTDEAAFRTFEHSDAHVGHRERLQPFREGGRMWTTTVVTELAGAGRG
ncbi:antibiotic biosynthesis monooxygenase family protein [Actinokineospora enzanensis]|uniref:antibiotic biosynthesis monooxygenase family protein n=1 Tax=Actinokineospora enzanensis TaxID=155975 RepID=UPI000382EA3A|nr:antibiotic biosynthesis monooxygenase family protein [Actinokineospora enzanensis]